MSISEEFLEAEMAAFDEDSRKAGAVECDDCFSHLSPAGIKDLLKYRKVLFSKPGSLYYTPFEAVLVGTGSDSHKLESKHQSFDKDLFAIGFLERLRQRWNEKLKVERSSNRC